MNAGALQQQLREQGARAGMPGDLLARALATEDWFLIQEWAIPRRGAVPEEQIAPLIRTAETLLRLSVFAHPARHRRGKRVPVVFGTGGHRGEIGWGLTFAHIHAILTALLGMIERLRPAERKRHFGAGTLAAVKERGFLIGHDNRLFNPEFSAYATHLLSHAGYRVAYAGRIATPELSYLTPRLGFAGAVNFTPSHNPFRYGGIKLNPADGGLAGGDLTDLLAEEANRLLDALDPKAWPEPEHFETLIVEERLRTPLVDLHEVYLQGLERHPVIRLGELATALRSLPPERRLAFVADATWGASVPVYRKLQARLGADVLTVLHTEDDPYFGGQTTEPNEQTLEDALSVLRRKPAPLKVAIRNDPDSDRGLVGDAAGAIKMNRFAPLVLRYLLDLGRDGGLVTTLPTSAMGPDFARARGKTVTITPTGFKNFRPHLLAGSTLVAYEESDGLSIQGHTLDKDGILAGLSAVRMVLHYGRPLSDLLRELEAELGVYHWHQETFTIDLSAKEAHQRLHALEAIRPGHTVEADGKTRMVSAVNTEDGYKFTFSDGAWMMMRPSGTEPKVRVYAETRESMAATRALCAAAKALALEAIHGTPPALAEGEGKP
jgi:phosphomannomutase